MVTPPVGCGRNEMKVYVKSFRRQRGFTATRDQDETSICQRGDKAAQVTPDVMGHSFAEAVLRIGAILQ